MLKLENKPKVIFITLGTRCNLNCVYCIEHSSGLILSEQELNYDIIEFIKQNEPKEIRFYGGEPLIYIDKIKEIVKQLKETKINYSIVTNGKLINEEMVNFFNKEHINIALSWDGKKSSATRKYDVLKENGDIIININRLLIEGVISTEVDLGNFLKDIVPYCEKYHAVHKEYPGVCYGLIYDLTGNLKKFTHFNFEDLSIKTQKLFNEIKESFNKPQKTFYDILLIRIYHQLFKDVVSRDKIQGAFCGSGTKTINLDLSGNIYACHNSKKIIGNIYDLYNKKLNENNEKVNERLENKCKNCEVITLCRGGCPLMTDNIKEKTKFCELRKTFYGEFLKSIKQMGVKNGI